MNKIVKNILDEMESYLSISQMKILQEVLVRELVISEQKAKELDNEEYLRIFLSAKSIEGCSKETLKYYSRTIRKMLKYCQKPIRKIATDDIRDFLSEYQNISGSSKVTIDNFRRNLSSFFYWLENESYIFKSPMKKMHKIRTAKVVKDTISDETIETLRDHTVNLRDLAIIDLLYSTGIRVGELVKLNRSDINFDERECVVQGKGSKERIVYFDAKTKIHLKNYLESRHDDNSALFVSLLKPYKRLLIGGVETRLRELGIELDINRVFPHKFRRTMATRAIDKGMPVEQLQMILGHSQIDTTMKYAMVNQTNVKNSHKKYLG